MEEVICLSDSDDTLPDSSQKFECDELISPKTDENCDLEEIPHVDFEYISQNYSPLRRRKSNSTSPAKKDNNPRPLKDRKKQRNPKPVDEEKLQRQRQTQRIKLEKRIARMIQKNLQQGECLKFVNVELDENLINFDFYQQSTTELMKAGINYNTKSQLIQNTVTWTKIIEEYSIDDNIKLIVKTREEIQKDILIIWGVEKIVEQIYNQEFEATISSIAAIFPDKSLTLVIYGIEGYFLAQKNTGRKRKNQENSMELKSLLKINRKDFEISLVNVQISVGCSSILVDDFEEMSLVIYQFTKSIAEIEYKEAKAAAMNEMEFFAAGDNKDTVKVDDNGNGLKRLWESQLCIFNSVGRATAETICSAYPSPLSLMNAYSNCSTEECENLLKDIRIQRAEGPSATSRRLGPELSKKLFIMFSSMNGEETLN